VHLLCQDREAGEYPWVDAVGGAGNGAGTVTVHVPDIGGLLPVYVADHYEGYEVKTFAELTDAELDAYIESNVSAVKDVVEAAGGIDAALANHVVMGPVILARAGMGTAAGGAGYAAKIHGSALEFTVKPEPERYLPFAREGLDGAACVLVGSHHTAASLWEAMGDQGLPGRTRLGPPGVDVELFAPLPPERREDELTKLAADIRALPDDHEAAFAREPAEAAAAIEAVAPTTGPLVVFVGKLIDTKGVDLLLASWPVVAGANPGARLVIAGFGEGRERIERFAAALADGDLDLARQVAAGEGDEQAWKMTGAFLAEPPFGYAEAAAEAAGSVVFAGRLEHDEVGRLVPACDALVMPSTFPEAFGMVAAEAASAGVLPVSAAHSGMKEVSRALAEALPEPARDLVSFDLGDRAVATIAGNLNGWLALEPAIRAETERSLRDTATRLWSWEGVAERILAASAGDLDDLPVVPDQ
jgi:glycosyltransferase involved in cell wall biosynthesis